MPSELRRRLHAADPNLIIIHPRRHKKIEAADKVWEKSAGVICPGCQREVFRTRDGLCIECWEKQHEIEIIDKAGITNWLGNDILTQITHLAGVKKS